MRGKNGEIGRKRGKMGEVRGKLGEIREEFEGNKVKKWGNGGSNGKWEK